MRHQDSVSHALLKRVPWGALGGLVAAQGASRRERGSSTKSQLAALLYGPLSGAASPRELAAGLASHAHRLHHLGISPARRSSPAEADARRPSAVFAEPVALMVGRAHRGLRRALDGTTDLIDATGPPLTARSAGWARFSARARGAKRHVIDDPHADRPVHAAVSAADVDDITAAKARPVEAGATYVFDLGDDDYARWAAPDARCRRIVTRLKRDTPLSPVEVRAVPAGGPVLADRIGLLPARQAGGRENPFRNPVRAVRVAIATGRVLRILTSDLRAPAQEIAALYERRWAIELSFRWVKQAPKITRFLGTSENAARIRIAAALIAFRLLRLARAARSAVAGPLAFARRVRAHLMHRRDLAALLRPEKPPPAHPHQLTLI